MLNDFKDEDFDSKIKNEDKMFSFKTVDEKLKFLDGINEYVMNLEQKYSDA